MRATHAEAPPSGLPHVPGSRQAAIYETNVRQFMAEDTLKAAAAELRRMGVDILWLMPIQPIQPIGQRHARPVRRELAPQPARRRGAS